MANEYLDHTERKFVRDVYLRKANVLRQFRSTLPGANMPIDEISPRHIHSYLKSLESNSLYNEHRQELSAFFNWVKKIYINEYPYLVNPCIAVESMTHVTKEKEIPTEKEILRLITASKGDERDIILTCLHTLGRIDEVLRLRWDDVNFEQRSVTLWTRKRKDGAYEQDQMPMNKDLYDVLWKRWKERKQNSWIFYNELTETRFMARPRMMKALCTKAGITNYGFHALRHFMASYLMDKEKVSLKTVSGLLRHKNVKTTEVYLHTLDQSKVLATGQIEGKFTLKKAKPQPKAATKKKRGRAYDS